MVRRRTGVDLVKADVGVVAIGRNEGERLVRCLASVLPQAARAVYVDSGSTDDSVAKARALGAEVVTLDLDVPFTAARARNAGFAHLRQRHPDLTWVQFLDGDCELDADWLAAGCAALEADAGLAVVCGRRRERHPERSIYNRLCDLEWDTVVGEVRSCGGDSLVRAAALHEVGGFDPTLIAGEEPELCFRLRAAGWRIRRLPEEMTRHDAAMTRFGQWWRRTIRAGHAAAEGAWMHGRSPERFNVRRVRSIVAWALGPPVLAALLAIPFGPWGLLALLAYPLLWLRVLGNERRRGPRFAALVATFTVLGKLPQLLGVAMFHLNRMRGRRARIVEYKGADG